MSLKRLIATTLVASLITGALPIRALAASDDASPAPTAVVPAPAPSPAVPPVDLRRDVRREAARLVAEHPLAARTAQPVRHEEGAMAPAQGGGGGMAVLMIVSLVVSAGIAYYVIKQQKKTQNAGQ
jgi:hypothetical protein